MVTFWRGIVLSIAAMLTFVGAAGAQGFAVGEKHVSARLVVESLTVPKGGTVRIALDATPDPDWHVYFANPGEAGQATMVNWTLPAGIIAGDWQWPVPERLDTLGLMSYGYSHQHQLITTFTNNSPLNDGAALPVRAVVTFLVCKDICIPETHELSLDLRVGPASPGPDAKLFAAADKAMPVVAPIAASVSLNGPDVLFSFKPGVGVQQALSAPREAYFYPLQEKVNNAAAPQALDMGPEGFTLRTHASKPELPAGPLSGILSVDGRAYLVALEAAPPLAGTFGLGGAQVGADLGQALWLTALLALLGGMILNLMPCVFPILSIKLLALTRAGHERGQAKGEALLYGAGVVVSFLALAAIIIAARAAGEAVGWGFQLQSPLMTALLSVVMLLVALNLAGLFNIGSSLQSFGAGAVDQKRPMLSAFLTGVLAVVVAAPCTAPFMATAIGAALAQGGLTAVVIFLALGVGFALPVVALTFLIVWVPAVARIIPKPGAWMEVFKQVLSVPMFGAVIWLVWVFAQQMGMGVVVLIGALGLLSLALAPLGWPRGVKIALMVAGLGLTGVAPFLPKPQAQAVTQVGHAESEPFSMAKLTQYREAGRPVLVDMTAAWCVTCKVNERLVFSTREFAEAAKDTGTVYMVGDWTNQDAEITRYLALYGRSGVPLYVYYPADKAEPVVLPQLLNTKDVVARLRAR